MDGKRRDGIMTTTTAHKITISDKDRRNLRPFMREHKKALRRSLIKQEGIWAVFYGEDVVGRKEGEER